MPSAYDQLEAAIVPDLQFRCLGRKLMAQRVLRLAIETMPLESLPESDRGAGERHRIYEQRRDWSAVVQREYKTRYGVSIIWVVILSAVIKAAIDFLLEWWFRADKRPTLQEAVRQMQNREAA